MGMFNDPMWGLNKINDTLYPDPSKQAGRTLGQIPEQTNKYAQPFFDQGVNQLPGLNDIYRKLMSNPDEIMKMLGQGYKESPGYQWNLKQGTEAINNANAAGGMLGSPQHEQMAGEMATGLASQDYQKFMDHIMQLFTGGITGSQGMANQGQAAGSDMAKRISEYLTNQAKNQYSGQQQKNENMAGLIGTGLRFAGGL